MDSTPTPTLVNGSPTFTSSLFSSPFNSSTTCNALVRSYNTSEWCSNMLYSDSSNSSHQRIRHRPPSPKLVGATTDTVLTSTQTPCINENTSAPLIVSHVFATPSRMASKERSGAVCCSFSIGTPRRRHQSLIRRTPSHSIARNTHSNKHSRYKSSIPVDSMSGCVQRLDVAHNSASLLPVHQQSGSLSGVHMRIQHTHLRTRLTDPVATIVPWQGWKCSSERVSFAHTTDLLGAQCDEKRISPLLTSSPQSLLTAPLDLSQQNYCYDSSNYLPTAKTSPNSFSVQESTLIEYTATQAESKMKCRCKKSRCLKLYCECFARGRMCGSICQCHDCYNDESHSEFRQGAVKLTLTRDPNAFHPKIASSHSFHTDRECLKSVLISTTNGSQASSDDFVSTVGVSTTDNSSNGSVRRHKRGCRCRKSYCRKGYCECFQAGVSCSHICGCHNCENREDTTRTDQELPLSCIDNNNEEKNESFWKCNTEFVLSSSLDQGNSEA